MKIAIFGGSFNPIHLGHIKLVKCAVEIASLDKVLLIPTGITPHKSNREMVSAQHRLEMCKIAVSSYENIEVSSIEINREGKSYTYQTLNSLKEIYANDEFYIIMGSDMYLSLHTWKNADSFLKNLNVISDLRNGADLKEMENQSQILQEYGAKSYFINHSVMTVSSTEIRNRLKNNQDVSDLLDCKVLEYIKTHHLYGM